MIIKITEKKITDALLSLLGWSFMFLVIVFILALSFKIQSFFDIGYSATDCYKREYLYDSNGQQTEYTKVTDMRCPK